MPSTQLGERSNTEDYTLRDRVIRAETRLDFSDERFRSIENNFVEIRGSFSQVYQKMDTIANELGHKIESLGERFIAAQLATATGKTRDAKDSDKFEKYVMRGIAVVMLMVIGYLLTQGTPYALRSMSQTQGAQRAVE